MRYFLGSGAVILALVATANVASAHNVGLSFNQVVGSYLIDVGYMPPIAQEGQQIAFDFKLWQADATTTPVNFTDVQTTITQKGQAQFSADIHNPQYTNTTLVYIPPTSGPISVDVKYQNGQNTLAEASFPLTVAPSAAYGSSLLPLLLAILFGILLGIGYSLLARKSRMADAQV